MWLAGQRPGQTSACAGCDKRKGELEKASHVPLLILQLWADEMHLPSLHPHLAMLGPIKCWGHLASSPGCITGNRRTRLSLYSPNKGHCPWRGSSDVELGRPAPLCWLLRAALAVLHSIPCLMLFLPGAGASVKDDNQCALCLPFFFAEVFGVRFLLLFLAGVFKSSSPKNVFVCQAFSLS